MRVAVHEGLFKFDDDASSSNNSATLIGGRCAECSEVHFPLLTTCPWCSADEICEVALSSEGTVWGSTVVQNAPPGYRGHVPFGFGVVELPEGLRVITRFASGDMTDLRFGAPVKCVADELYVDDDGNQVVTFAFMPTPTINEEISGGSK